MGKDISKIYNDIVKDIKGVVKIVGNLEVWYVRLYLCKNFYVWNI